MSHLLHRTLRKSAIPPIKFTPEYKDVEDVDEDHPRVLFGDDNYWKYWRGSRKGDTCQWLASTFESAQLPQDGQKGYSMKGSVT